MTKEFRFCSLCKINHDQGRQHVYKPGHKKNLEQVLGKALTRMKDVRFFLSNIVCLKEEDRSKNKHWCTFCRLEVPEDETILVCENTIHHLASDSHAEKVREFWVEHGADYSRRQSFVISKEDLAKWGTMAAVVKSRLSNSPAAKPAATNIQTTVGNGPVSVALDGCNSITVAGNQSDRLSAHYAMAPSGFPSLSRKATRQHEPVVVAHDSLSRAAGLSAVIAMAGDRRSEVPTNLGNDCLDTTHRAFPKYLNHMEETGSAVQGTSRNHLPMSPGGNVHTGGCPPWFQRDKISNQTTPWSLQPTTVAGGPGGKKLNPNRVGAAWAERRRRELEEEKAGMRARTKPDASWRPNFGGIWDGRRKEHHKPSKRQRASDEGHKPMEKDLEERCPSAVPANASHRMRMNGPAAATGDAEHL